jgi:glucosamine kinase
MRFSDAPGIPSLDAACVGLSGVSHPASGGIVKQAFETANMAVRGPRILAGDAVLVLEAAFGCAAPSGVVLISGTGTIALARDASGGLVRAGGEGPERGDAGGGHWVGREALRLGVVDAPSDGTGRPADLAPLVVAAARRGDARATDILGRAARELAALVRTASGLARLGESFEVRVAGGLAVNAPDVVLLFERELLRMLPGARLGPLVRDPILGALVLATRAIRGGSSVPPGW